MKNFFLIILIGLVTILPVSARPDKTSPEYLKNKKHFAIANPFAENIAQKIIKNALKKEIGNGLYYVKFTGYTLSSMRKGIFKSLEISAKDLVIDNIPIPFIGFKSLSDYNWVDYNVNPIKIRSDMIFSYYMELSEESINIALKHKDYQKKIETINNKAYPLFTIHSLQTRVKNNRIYLIIEYSLPLASTQKKRKFIVASNFKVNDGKINATDIYIDKRYGNLSLEKVTNLINLLDPLTFTIGKLNESRCKTKMESINIDNDIIQINGKIFIEKSKGD